jgi:hypothetical protein
MFVTENTRLKTSAEQQKTYGSEVLVQRIFTVLKLSISTPKAIFSAIINNTVIIALLKKKMQYLVL